MDDRRASCQSAAVSPNLVEHQPIKTNSVIDEPRFEAVDPTMSALP